MKSKLIVSVENPILFRFLFFIFLVITPIITNWISEFSSLYVLTVIFLGFGFSNKSSWFLFFSCTLIVLIRSTIIDEYYLTALLVRWFVYLVVVFISAEVTKQVVEIIKNKNDLIITLAKSLDSRDTNTANHSENVAKYAILIAKEMKLSKRHCDNIFIGGLLHDFGKIGIPELILTKSTKLTTNEYDVIKQHPFLGYETLKHISSFNNRGIVDMVLYHHERYDGKGYPYGLRGEEIPLEARIIALADSYDAMTSKRHYKDEMDMNYAINEIQTNKGTQFDPELADLFIKVLKRERPGMYGHENVVHMKKVQN